MQQRLCLLSTAKRQPGPKHLPLCALGGSTSWPTGFSKLRSIRTRIIERRARLILPEGDDGERIDPAVSLICGRGSPRGIATGETEGPKAVNILVSRAVEAALLKGKTCAFNRYPSSPPLLRSWARQVRRRWDRSLLPSRAISLSEASTSTRRTAR